MVRSKIKYLLVLLTHHSYAVMKLHNAIKSESWKPTVLVLNNTQLSQLLLDNKFIEYNYPPSKGTDIEAGLIREILGMKVEPSTLVPNGTAYAIDKDIAGIMLLRRDVMLEDWSNLRADTYGLKESRGLGWVSQKTMSPEKMLPRVPKRLGLILMQL